MLNTVDRAGPGTTLSLLRSLARIGVERFALLLVASLALGEPVHAQTRRPTRPDTLPPLAELVRTAIRPQLARLGERLLTEQRALVLDGTSAFGGGDKFLPGKIAIGMAHLVTDAPVGSVERTRWVAGFRTLADVTVDDPNETWGIYYYLSALVRLQRAGVLNDAVSPATLDRLRRQLDWRPFVRVPGYTLVNLPTNYYGVAFSVARLRHLLGWESADAADSLLARTVGHYRQFSGEYGFSDETDGDGRFDRYSVLLIGELCQRHLETGLPVSDELRHWLRRAVDVVLLRLTPSGEGFDFGRSIGPYGETAFLEVLTAAAKLGVLTSVEQEMAYAYSVRAVQRYARFWYDSGMQSVNLWEQGRRTDGYRGKHRILGENLSLTHQVLYTTRLWDEIGMATRRPSPGYEAWLRARPVATLTWFARGSYDRALITVRDGLRVFSLPIVNGGSGQHDNSPYYPIPFSHGLLSGVAEFTFPQLVPAVGTAHGDSTRWSLPLAYHAAVAMEQTGNTTHVRWRQPMLDRVGGRSPVPDSSVRSVTAYRFSPGAVAREDTLWAASPRAVSSGSTAAVTVESFNGSSIEVRFASFDSVAKVTQESASRAVVTYAGGTVEQAVFEGYGRCSATALPASSPYQAPTGALRSLVQCTGPLPAGPVHVARWQLRYRR